MDIPLAMRVKEKNNITPEGRFLLVWPLTVGEIPRPLAMLGGVLKHEGWEVKAVVNTFKKPLEIEDYVKIAVDWGATHVGLSLVTLQILEAYKIVEAMRKALPDVTILMGGPHPSSVPVEAIERGADIVVRGEGEITLHELCRFWKGELVESNLNKTMLTAANMDKANEAFASKRVNETRASKALEEPLRPELAVNDLSKIRSITYRDKETGEIISTPPRKLIGDLNDLPSPTHDIFDDDAFRVGSVVRGHHRLYTTRGCPGRCTYCNSGVFGSKIRCYSVQRVLDRIREVIDSQGITNFSIADDNFTTIKSHVYSMCEGIAKEFPNITWRVNSRVDMVNPEMLTAMKEAGCYMISYGIESGDQETLDKLRKRVKVQRNHDAIWQTYEAGIQVFANMMVGLPGEEEHNIKNGIKFFHDVKEAVHLWQLSGAIIPLPGTAMYYDLSEKNGFKEYWLRDDPHMQAAGIQTWQNSSNPYEVSTYFQRNIFDDNFIATGKFFEYTKQHQKWLKELMFLYGTHNIKKLYDGKPLKQKWIELLGRMSYFVYHNIDPTLEMKVVNWWQSRKNKDAEELSRWSRLGLRDKMAKNELNDSSVGDDGSVGFGSSFDVNTGVRKVGHGRMMEDDRLTLLTTPEVPNHMKPRNTF